MRGLRVRVDTKKTRTTAYLLQEALLCAGQLGLLQQRLDDAAAVVVAIARGGGGVGAHGQIGRCAGLQLHVQALAGEQHVLTARWMGWSE